MFSLNNLNELTVTELRERPQTGLASNTVNPDLILDTSTVVDDSMPLNDFMLAMGIVFISTDGLISISSDLSVDVPDLNEGARTFIDANGGLTTVTLIEG